MKIPTFKKKSRRFLERSNEIQNTTNKQCQESHYKNNLSRRIDINVMISKFLKVSGSIKSKN